MPPYKKYVKPGKPMQRQRLPAISQHRCPYCKMSRQISKSYGVRRDGVTPALWACNICREKRLAGVQYWWRSKNTGVTRTNRNSAKDIAAKILSKIENKGRPIRLVRNQGGVFK